MAAQPIGGKRAARKKAAAEAAEKVTTEAAEGEPAGLPTREEDIFMLAPWWAGDARLGFGKIIKFQKSCGRSSK